MAPERDLWIVEIEERLAQGRYQELSTATRWAQQWKSMGSHHGVVVVEVIRMLRSGSRPSADRHHEVGQR